MLEFGIKLDKILNIGTIKSATGYFVQYWLTSESVSDNQTKEWIRSETIS